MTKVFVEQPLAWPGSGKKFSFITRSLIKFSLEDIYLILGPLAFLVCPKAWFLDLHQVKVIHYCRYLMLFSKKEQYQTTSANC